METYYKGKHIVKFVQNDNYTLEIYVEFEGGQVWLRSYINGSCVGEFNVANVKGAQSK